MRTVIWNGKLILKDNITEEGFVEINDGIISQISVKNPKKEILLNADSVFDANGKYISPGFIDIHNHGGGGYDFGIGNEDSFIIPCETHALHGTTSLYPTISSSTFEIMENASTLRKSNPKKLQGATMRGCT